MINAGNWDWIVNTDDMTCKNIENDVIVKMENTDGHLKAKLHYMPMELFAKISGYNNGEKIIEEIVRKAEEKYLEVRDQGSGIRDQGLGNGEKELY